MTKLPVEGTVRVRVYDYLNEQMIGAIMGGLRRYYKHKSQVPSERDMEVMCDEVHGYVMNALCEVLEFGDGNEDA